MTMPILQCQAIVCQPTLVLSAQSACCKDEIDIASQTYGDTDAGYVLVARIVCMNYVSEPAGVRHSLKFPSCDMRQLP